MNNVFEYIINKQTTPECIKIYKNECNNNTLLPSSMKIVIKNNSIHESFCNCMNSWEQRYLAYKKMIEETLKKYPIKDSIIKISLCDNPKKGYFHFCKNKNNTNSFLIPNFRFVIDNVITNNYYQYKTISSDWCETINYIYNNDKKFNDKLDKFIFIGGQQHAERERYFKLVYENYNNDDLNNIFDGYLWTQKYNKLFDIKKSGKEFKKFETYFDYKYPLYFDGSTNSDRFRLFMLMNCVPFYCKSPYEEFYTYLLKPNENYIEFDNVKQLEKLYDKYKNDTILHNSIIQNNKKFIQNILTTENIYLYISKIINELNP